MADKKPPKNEHKPFWEDVTKETPRSEPKSKRPVSGEKKRNYIGDKKRKPFSKTKKGAVSTPPQVFPEPNPNEAVRLNRFIAQAGVCSRREADVLIGGGKIKVNGKVMTVLGTKIIPKEDKVTYMGQVLESKKFVYILLNKPKNTITTNEDPEGRRTVLDSIERATQERVFPVGRLDRNTTGLLIMTNDGELTTKLTHPSYEVQKIYHVRVDKPVSREHMDQLLAGVTLEDGPAKVDEMDYVFDKGPNEVGVVIHMGRNRIVRRMFEHLGYQVETLDRVAFATLTKKNLPRGKWRELTPKEVGFLKMTGQSSKKGNPVKKKTEKVEKTEEVVAEAAPEKKVRKRKKIERKPKEDAPAIDAPATDAPVMDVPATDPATTDQDQE